MAMVILVFAISCKNNRSNSNEIVTPIFEDAYLGQKRPGLMPEPFAPGIISTDNWEASGVFIPDLKEFYFV